MSTSGALTLEVLTDLEPSQQKRLIGDRLYTKIIENVEQRLAGKITGMLLEMDNQQLLLLLSDKQQLIIAINAALDVFNDFDQKEMSSNANQSHQTTSPSIDEDFQDIKSAERKRSMGERLFVKISKIQPVLAPKLTGMILEMPEPQLLVLLSDSKALQNAVNTAISVLNGEDQTTKQLTQDQYFRDIATRIQTACNNGEYEKVIEYCGEGIDLDPSYHLFSSTRCMAYTLLHKYEEALNDANTCIELKPNSSDGYVWKCRILIAMNDLLLAVKTFNDGLRICSQINAFKVLKIFCRK